MESGAPRCVSLLCPKCDQTLAVGEVSDEDLVSWAIPERPGAPDVRVSEVPPPPPVRIDSWAEVDMFMTQFQNGSPDHYTFAFRRHRPRVSAKGSSHWCTATPQLRREKLEVLIRGAIHQLPQFHRFEVSRDSDLDRGGRRVAVPNPEVVRGDRWIVEGLAGGWAISLVPSSARAKWRVKQFPAFLADLEAAEVRSIDVEPGQVRLGKWQSRARDLGIANIFRSEAEVPGSVYMSLDAPLERSAGVVPPTGDPIAEWVGDFLRQERTDVLAKLGRSEAEERHAFVFVPGFTTAPFSVSVLLIRPHVSLPVADPQLPIEVTHVWVVGMWHEVEGCYWAPDTGWSAVVTPPSTSA